MEEAKGEFGRRLRELRLHRHLKREDIEEATGIGTGEQSKLERGLHDPKLHTLQVMSNGLKAHLRDLTHGLLTEPGAWRAEVVPLREAHEMERVKAELGHYIGCRLKAERLAKGLTQAQLASCSGTSLRTIQRLEAGHFAKQFSSLIRLAVALGTDLHHMLPPPALSPGRQQVA